RAPLWVEPLLPALRVQPLPRRLGPTVPAAASAKPNHVDERPVRADLTVGEAATAVPVHEVDDPVEVLVELPRQPGIADPGDAGDRDQVRAALVRAAVEEVLDQLQLAVAADERRLEAGRLERAAAAGDHAA